MFQFLKNILSLVLLCGGLWLGTAAWMMMVENHHIAAAKAAAEPAYKAELAAYCERLHTRRPDPGDDLDAIRYGTLQPNGSVASPVCPAR